MSFLKEPPEPEVDTSLVELHEILTEDQTDMIPAATLKIELPRSSFLPHAEITFKWTLGRYHCAMPLYQCKLFLITSLTVRVINRLLTGIIVTLARDCDL